MKTENEIWKDIPGYEGLYQVSSLGRVKSLDRLIKGKYILKGIILKPSYGGNKYPSVNFWIDKKYKTFTIHRLVAVSFIENPKNLKFVNHINGNKYDFNISNLEWCTHKQNMIHASKTGLLKPHMIGKTGSKHYRSKPVLMIKNNEIVCEFESLKDAQKETGINRGTISKYCRLNKPNKNYSWKFKQ